MFRNLRCAFPAFEPQLRSQQAQLLPLPWALPLLWPPPWAPAVSAPSAPSALPWACQPLLGVKIWEPGTVKPYHLNHDLSTSLSQHEKHRKPHDLGNSDYCWVFTTPKENPCLEIDHTWDSQGHYCWSLCLHSSRGRSAVLCFLQTRCFWLCLRFAVRRLCFQRLLSTQSSRLQKS